jgi:hypothetical protein
VTAAPLVVSIVAIEIGIIGLAYERLRRRRYWLYARCPSRLGHRWA